MQGKARMSNVMEDINELCQYDSEYGWFEFKENWYKPDELGEYKSAIANSLFTGTVYQNLIWEGKSYEVPGKGIIFI